jgi:hypothetical protein
MKTLIYSSLAGYSQESNACVNRVALSQCELTGLVLDHQLQVLDVVTVNITGGARQSEIGGEAGACFDDV